MNILKCTLLTRGTGRRVSAGHGPSPRRPAWSTGAWGRGSPGSRSPDSPSDPPPPSARRSSCPPASPGSWPWGPPAPSPSYWCPPWPRRDTARCQAPPPWWSPGSGWSPHQPPHNYRHHNITIKNKVKEDLILPQVVLCRVLHNQVSSSGQR